MYVDAKDSIAGRLASVVAKELLKGKSVFVVNAEKAVVSGDPKHTGDKFVEKVNRGDPYHGPFYPKVPDRVLKRIVRGMLPYNKPRGREALKRLKVYISIPEELKGKEFAKIKEAENKLEGKFVTIGKLSEKLGVKYES